MNKKVKILNLILIPTALIFMTSTKVSAGTNANLGITVSSYKNSNLDKTLMYEIGYKKIDRVKTLEIFFSKYNSPLKANAETFIRVADKYKIDYKLLPAIACMESTCGKFIIKDSYNPFGWGIYGNNYIKFKSFDEAIETVGEGLNKNYFAKGFDTPKKIAPIYTPPNSYNWYRGVTLFTSEIDEISSKM